MVVAVFPADLYFTNHMTFMGWFFREPCRRDGEIDLIPPLAIMDSATPIIIAVVKAHFPATIPKPFPVYDFVFFHMT